MTFRAHDSHVHITPRPGGGSNADDYVATRDAHAIGMAAIVTPSTMGWDNELSFAVAATDPARFRVIARIDLRAADAVATTRAALDRGAAGVRVTLMGEPDISWLDDGLLDESLATIAARAGVVEFHAAPEQLPAVGRAAARHPGATVLVDHMGRPDPAAGAASAPYAGFLELAALPNVAAKTPNSSFFSRDGAPYADLIPFYERALDAFGPRRLMWSSDWPLCVERDPFSGTFEPLTAVLGGAASADADAVWRGTFERLLGGGS